jgi:predicted Zn-dependent protease with MMP-like domain
VERYADVMDWRELLDEAVELQRDGRFRDALQLCDRAAMSGGEARYFAALMRGDVLLDLGDPLGALSSYDSVAEPSVPDPELDCARGVALFELVRFPEAENALRSALRGDATLAEAHYTLGLIAEILGTGREVEHFRQARRLDPEAYPPHAQLSREAFEAAVEQALLDLPEPVRDATCSTPVLVADVPQLADLTQSQPPLSPTVLGLFVGPMPQETSILDPPAEQQPTILLFKRNLERACSDRETLVREIRTTVVHEVGHAIGLSEADLFRLGLD